MRPAPPLKHEVRVLEDNKTVFEKDIGIVMRDGVKIYADLYRPIDSIAAKTPTIVLFSPFGKHGGVPLELFQNMGVDFSHASKYTQWELPDPFAWWHKHASSV
jgi:predicted acyl esterase